MSKSILVVPKLKAEISSLSLLEPVKLCISLVVIANFARKISSLITCVV